MKLRWRIVACLVGVVVLSYFDRVNFSMAAPLIMKEIGLDAAQLGIIMSAFTVGYMIVNFGGGFVVHRWGASRTLAIILLLWSIFTIFTGLAGSFLTLIVIRVIFGMCEGPMLPANSLITSRWMLPKERATTSGIWMAAIPVGVMVGNVLSGYIVANLGWRSVFFIFGAVGIPFAYFLYKFLADNPEDHKKISKEELDLINNANAGAPAQTASGSTFSQMISNPWVWLIGLVYSAAAMLFWANVNWLPTYFIKARGFNLVQAGFLASLPWIGAIIGPPLMGMISDRTRHLPRTLWLAIILFLAAPFTVYAVLAEDITMCLVAFTVSTLFNYGSSSLLWTLSGELFDRADVAKAGGMMLGVGSLSGVLAPIIVGYVLKQTNSFNIAYFIFAGIVFVAGLLALVLMVREKHLRKHQTAAA